MDDVINVSGHRIGTAEIESALVMHPKCAEAACIGINHDIKGYGRVAVHLIVVDRLYSATSYSRTVRRRESTSL